MVNYRRLWEIEMKKKQKRMEMKKLGARKKKIELFKKGMINLITLKRRKRR